MAKASVKQRAAKPARPAKSARPTQSAAASKSAVAKAARPAARAVAKSPTPARPAAKAKPAPRAATKPSAPKARPTAAAKPAPAAKSAKPLASAKPVAPAKPVAKPTVASKPVAPGKPSVVPAKPSVAAKAVVATKPEPAAKAAPAKPAVNGNLAPAPAETPKPSGGFRLSQGPFVGNSLTKKGTFAPNKLVVPAPKLKKVERPVAPVVAPPPPPVPAVATSEKAQKNRAGLGPKDLEFFRDLLLAKRRELLGDMSSMEREALREGTSDLSTLPIHMADQGTDAYEQEFTLGLVEKDRTLLREINNALAKIQNGSYGICEGTGLPISKPRLEAQPWAKFSIEHARALEKRQMMFRRG